MADSWKNHSELDFHFTTPRSFFGEEDAEAEWEDDPQQSASLFLHTDSYEEFRRIESLFLFGRRGTGKTAIIRMLDYSVRTGRESRYNFSFVLPQEDAYHDLAIQLRGSPLAQLPEAELIHFLVKKWKWVLLCAAMLAYLNENDPEANSKDECVIKIRKFLVAESLPVGHSLPNVSPWRRAINALIEGLEGIDYQQAQLGLAVARISSKLGSAGFDEATSALASLLTRQKSRALILIDSVEIYDIRDQIPKAVVSSLIEAVRQLYIKRNSLRVLAKAAFPSEVYPHLTSVNQEKVQGKNLFLLWRYSDLVCLIAARHMRKFRTGAVREFKEYREARDYLYGSLPPTVRSSQGVSFDTLAYIVRHTQKKPRQLILIFNLIYTIAEIVKVRLPEIKNPEIVVRGVHSRLDVLVKGTLDIWDQVYPNCERIVRRILNKAPSELTESTIDKAIKEAKPLMVQSQLSSEEVKQMLFETGAIGLIERTRQLRGSQVVVKEGLFEYQVKGVLSFSSLSQLSVHPMFYQELKTEVDQAAFIYPVPFEQEEREMLEDLGLILR